MKHLFFLLVVFTVTTFATSCRKSDANTTQSKGLITGEDYGACAICGGYFIKIQDSTYRFWYLPANANFSLVNTSYPIKVLLSWRRDTIPGRGVIIVDWIQKY